MSTVKKIVTSLASLELTLICLTAAMVLVFAGTLAQVNYNVHEVQQRYFESLFVWWQPDEESWFKLPLWPGGSLLGILLLINLIAAHISRFQLKWSKIGIQLTHAGLIILLTGGVLTGLFSVSGYMPLAPGETKNYTEDSETVELAVMDETDPKVDQVTAIPQSILSQEDVIEHASLPFKIAVNRYYKNTQLEVRQGDAANQPAASDHGIGTRISIQELPPVTSVNDQNQPAAVIEILPSSPSANGTPSTYGKWLVSPGLGAPQTFSSSGKKWRIEMRPTRHYKTYDITLKKFTHERYPGTDIPKDFASQVIVTDAKNGKSRDALIYMNHPLRYEGDTLYQSGFDKSDTGTVLQVVHNPGFLAPYIACVIVGTGLLIQFAFHFISFIQGRKKI